MLEINATGDYLAERIAHDLALDNAKQEAVSAKAEFIENQLLRGVEVEGHSMDSIIETILDSDGINNAVKVAYLYGNTQAVDALVNAEITRLANTIAPDLVAAHLEDVA